MKRIFTTLKSKWPEYLLEILVLIVGIYGAFALESWNEDRKSASETQRILLDLKEEFLDNKANVQKNITQNKKVISANYQAMDMLREGTRITENAQFDSLLNIINNFGSFDPQSGVSNEIINGGKLSLITNTALKKKITGWSSLIYNAQENYGYRDSHWVLVLGPYLAKYTNLVNVDRYVNYSFWSTEGYKSTRKAVTPLKISTKFRPAEFENLLYIHKMNSDFIVISEMEIEKYIDKTLDLINKNLAEL